MKLRILLVSKGTCAWADAAQEDYARRIQRFAATEEIALRPEPFRGNIDTVRAAEAKRILNQITPRDEVIALDERGKDLASKPFASVLKRARISGTHRLVFVLGGPYGLDPTVREQAKHTIRLSTLVLNHQVARIVLYEQLYRATTLIQGTPYHH